VGSGIGGYGGTGGIGGDGVTGIGGLGTGGDSMGGGISILGGSLDLTDSMIIGNIAEGGEGSGGNGSGGSGEDAGSGGIGGTGKAKGKLDVLEPYMPKVPVNQYVTISIGLKCNLGGIGIGGAGGDGSDGGIGGDGIGGVGTGGLGLGGAVYNKGKLNVNDSIISGNIVRGGDGIGGNGTGGRGGNGSSGADGGQSAAPLGLGVIGGFGFGYPNVIAFNFSASFDVGISGGLIGGNGGDGGDGGYGRGGNGIGSYGSGGGIYNNGLMSMENTTIIDSSAESGNGIGGYGYGGENGIAGIHGSSAELSFSIKETLLAEINIFKIFQLREKATLPIYEGSISVLDPKDGTNGIKRSGTNGVGFHQIGNGGGIANQADGVMQLNGSNVSQNIAAYGGGIYNAGLMNVTYSNISWNEAYSGSGIYNVRPGRFDLGASRIFNNSATGNGGGIYNFGMMNVTDSNISWNEAYSGSGIYNDEISSLNLSSSQIIENNASKYGGGICNIGYLWLRTGTSIKWNRADYGGGVYELVEPLVNSSTVEENLARIEGDDFYRPY